MRSLACVYYKKLNKLSLHQRGNKIQTKTVIVVVLAVGRERV
jgi:hypothetical protein